MNCLQACSQKYENTNPPPQSIYSLKKNQHNTIIELANFAIMYLIVPYPHNRDEVHTKFKQRLGYQYFNRQI